MGRLREEKAKLDITEGKGKMYGREEAGAGSIRLQQSSGTAAGCHLLEAYGQLEGRYLPTAAVPHLTLQSMLGEVPPWGRAGSF